MSIATAIGDVSRALCSLLEDKLSGANISVTMLAPDEASRGSDRRINLFLYKVQENPELKNLHWHSNPEKPPLSLNLFYLMTPYAPSENGNRNATAHEILSEAMRVFHQNSVIPKDFLEGNLVNSQEQLQIMLNPSDLEELSRIWTTSSQPFRLSVTYEVSVVQLAAGEPSEPSRVEKIELLEMRVPYQPPVLERIEPESIVEGTPVSIRIFGQHLAGWKARVTLIGKVNPPRSLTISPIDADTKELTADIFTTEALSDLSPDLCEIRVGVSSLCRRTFLFRVLKKEDRADAPAN